MFLKLEDKDIINGAVKGVVDDKEVKFLMRVKVDESNIKEVIKKHRVNKNIVAYDYTGDLEYLNSLDLTGVLVVVETDIDTIDSKVDDMLGKAPDEVRLVFKLPETYSDMKLIKEYCEKYKNIRFCGGNLLRLEGVRLGCLGVEDIDKKIPESRIPLVTTGCACVMRVIDINDLSTVEFYDNKKVSSIGKVKKESKSVVGSKRVSSLLKKAKMQNEDNF